jgi:internalin A
LSTSSNLLVNVMLSTNVVLQKNLSNAVSAALGYPAGNLTSLQLMYLTSLFANNAHISNLSGLESASNLTTLDLDGNTIHSLTPLQNLTGLVTLSLSDNLITDVSPLAGLTNLTYLDLSWNPVTNFAALSGLANLTTLYLAGDSFNNLSFLTNFSRLINLDLSFNGITDLTPLGGLTNLTSLYLQQNRITDISPLTNLTHLVYVDLSLNLLKSSAIGILASNGVMINFSPQRTPPVIDVNTNWTVPVNSSNANYVLPFNVSDTGPTSEQLGIGASASSAGLALKWTLTTSPGANESWTLVASNYIATNTVLIILTATNDAGLYTNATVTLNPIILLGIVGTVTKTQCNLQLSVMPGHSYEIQVSTNLHNWSNLALVVPTNSPIFFIDTNAARSPRFYRLQGL